MPQNAEFSIEHPEGTPQERQWNSVMLDYPFFGGQSREQSGFHRAFNSTIFSAGRLNDTPGHLRGYIARWIAAGFTPELYWAVNAGIERAVAHARWRCKNAEDLLRVEERLRQLGILAPNPRAGQIFKELRPGNDPAAARVWIERRYPDHIVQLEPEQWAEFPQRLQVSRPSVALQQFIYGNPSS